jgi:WD40 repeat protein
LVAGNKQGEVTAWKWSSRTEVARWTFPDEIPWERLVFAPDGNRFAAVAWDRRLEAWVLDLEEPAASWRVPAKQSKCADFSADGRHLAVANMDDGVLFAWKTLSMVRRFVGHSNTLSDLAFSPDGQMLATVSHDRKLRLWDAQTGEELYTIVAHRDWVRSVDFAPDGWSLVTSGDDGRVRLWHAETGQLLLELPDEGHGVWKARFSPDGRRVACHTNDARIVLYDAYPRHKKASDPRKRT